MTYDENDEFKAVCFKCKELVYATFKRRKFSFSYDSTMLSTRPIQVGVCKKCDTTITVAGKEAVALHDAIVKHNAKKESR